MVEASGVAFVVAIRTVCMAGRLIVISLRIGAASWKDGRCKMIGTFIAVSTGCPVEGGVAERGVAGVAGWHLIQVNNRIFSFQRRGFEGNGV